MLISKLLEKLEQVKELRGDIPVSIEVGYVGGDYGGLNCVAKASVDGIDVYEGEAVILGDG